VDAALRRVEEIIGTKPILGNNRTGELAMQRMIRSVGAATREAKPPHAVGLQIRPEVDNPRLPIFFFLYGDHCATYTAEANAIIADVLETSGMVFGLGETEYLRGPPGRFEGAGQTWNLVHYYAGNTGGQYYSTSHPELYADTLDYIIT
jgi:hypothetical protein